MKHALARPATVLLGGLLLGPHLVSIDRVGADTLPPGAVSAVFVANHGQTHSAVRFLSRGGAVPIFFTDRDARFVLERDGGRAAISFELVGSHAAAVEGRALARTQVNDLRAGGARQLPSYREVIYRNAWPGIDALFREDGRKLTYEFVVAPHAQVDDIRVRYAGADAVRLNADGSLTIATSVGEITDAAPFTYQSQGEERVPIDSQFVVHRDGTIGFAIESYDPSRPLVIDPSIVYGTFLGGSHWDGAENLAIDALGAAYIVGRTHSADFPVTPGVVDSSVSGDHDAFVAKLTSDGDAFEYVTYLGGEDFDMALGVAVDGSGSAWVVGYTRSLDFPSTSNALSRTKLSPGTNMDGFVVKLNAHGTTLLYATYLGTNRHSNVTKIALDAGGNAHVAGYTEATNIPTTANALSRSLSGSSDGFVMKFSSTGTLAYGSYIGGNVYETIYDVDVDAAGMTYLAGTTGSANFPTTAGAHRRTLSGVSDGFVTKINTNASTGLAYSTYVGGPSYDEARAIAVNDQTGEAHVLLNVDGQQTAFPVGGTAGPAIAKFNASGTTLVYARGLGPRYTERTAGVEIDLTDQGTPYVTGLANEGRYVWVSRLDDRGIEASLIKVNEFGGGTVAGMAADEDDNVLLAGTADPGGIPITEDAVQPVHAGNGEDAYLVEINFSDVATEDVASRKLAQASSVESSRYAPANALDGDLSTRWSSQFSDPQWITVDLGQRYKVDRVVLHWEAAFGSNYELHISDDGVTWFPLRSRNRDARFLPLADGGVDSHTNLDGTGRYVRMYGLARGTQWGYSLFEMEVFGTPVSAPAPAPGSQNLARGGRFGYSGIESLEYYGAYAFDGDLRTRWSSEFRDPQWIWVDLGARVDISRVVLRWETAFARDYTIQVSNDSANWQVVRSVTNGDGGVDDLSGINVRARYVMMHGTRRATQWGYSLWEFAVYGAINDGKAPPTTTANDIVLYAADAQSLVGLTLVNDSTAAGGQKISSVDEGRAWLDEADVSAPRAVFEFDVQQAGTYRLWLRLRGQGNSKWNESVWVGFSDATRNAQPIYRSEDLLLVNLENCSGCGIQDWGWQDNSWWLNQSSVVHLPEGRQSLYVYLREDGVEFDQVVLSPERFFNAAPGPVKSDPTIVAKP